PLVPVGSTVSMSWDDCVSALRGACAYLALPTEAQWEYGCRAGTKTPWWTGADAQSLRGAANIRFDASERGKEAMRVGGLRANPFGLHDVHGNVSEWCRDASDGMQAVRRAGDGLYDRPDAWSRVLRGGDSQRGASEARSARRSSFGADVRFGGQGLR